MNMRYLTLLFVLAGFLSSCEMLSDLGNINLTRTESLELIQQAVHRDARGLDLMLTDITTFIAQQPTACGYHTFVPTTLINANQGTQWEMFNLNCLDSVHLVKDIQGGEKYVYQSDRMSGEGYHAGRLRLTKSQQNPNHWIVNGDISRHETTTYHVSTSFSGLGYEAIRLQYNMTLADIAIDTSTHEIVSGRVKIKLYAMPKGFQTYESRTDATVVLTGNRTATVTLDEETLSFSW